MNTNQQSSIPLEKQGIHFGLKYQGKLIPDVVWFANWPTRMWDGKKWNDPPRFKGKVPETWKEGYTWGDLNILPQAVFEYQHVSMSVWPRRTDRIDYEGLYSFIAAFMGETPNGIYMHVWDERLPRNNSQDRLSLTPCSPWTIVDGYCAARTLNGERVAFIEKTPRVKHPETGEWVYGIKGAGGVGADNCNGGYQPSRDWADAKLIELGYSLANG